MKGSVACHSGKNIHGRSHMSKYFFAVTRGQKGLKVRDREEEVQEGQEGSKRQRKKHWWKVGKVS